MEKYPKDFWECRKQVARLIYRLEVEIDKLDKRHKAASTDAFPLVMLGSVRYDIVMLIKSITGESMDDVLAEVDS